MRGAHAGLASEQEEAKAPRVPPVLRDRQEEAMLWAWHGHPGSLGVFWQVSLDKELVDFGSCVVGETASRAITLTNVGSLGTTFRFLRVSESCEVDASPVSVLPRALLGHSCSARLSRGCELQEGVSACRDLGGPSLG